MMSCLRGQCIDSLTQDGLPGEGTQAGRQPPPFTDTQWRLLIVGVNLLGNAITLYVVETVQLDERWPLRFW